MRNKIIFAIIMAVISILSIIGAVVLFNFLPENLTLTTDTPFKLEMLASGFYACIATAVLCGMGSIMTFFMTLVVEED